MNNWYVGERVSIYVKERGKGKVGGWIETVYHGTIKEIYKKSALVEVDIYSLNRTREYKFKELRSHKQCHEVEHK